MSEETTEGKTKYADYYITDAHKDKGNRFIEWLEVRERTGRELSPPHQWTRDRVVRAITRRKKTFVTSIMIAEGEFDTGPMVRTYERDGEFYLRSVANDEECDNLGELTKDAEERNDCLDRPDDDVHSA